MTEKPLQIRDTNDLYCKTFEIGSLVKLKRDYNTFKASHIYELTGFINDDPEKLILKGGIPGGWVNTKHIYRTIDYTNLRYLSIEEVADMIGSSFLISYNLGIDFLRILGNIVSKPIYVHDSDMISCQDYGNKFILSLLTRSPYKGQATEISITIDDRRDELKSTIFGKEHYIKRLKQYEITDDMLGNQIEVISGKKACKKFLVTFLMNNGGYCMYKDKKVLYEFLKLNFKYESKEEQIEKKNKISIRPNASSINGIMHNLKKGVQQNGVESKVLSGDAELPY